MKNWLILFFLFCIIAKAQAQYETAFEASKGKRSTDYKEMMRYYRMLDADFKTVKMEVAGATDAYYPLHVVYFSNDAKFDVDVWKEQGKIVLLINNGIHPGEPDGIDASMMLLRDAAMGRIKIPGNVVLAVIPVFNVGGMLNRGSYSRANQNGPEAYGFRGNSQNLDLNRDFMKMDAKETRSLIELFHMLDPDLFIDNHVSDGADYQHVMTLLSTQHNKLGGEMGMYLNRTLEPLVYADMKTRGYDMVPYVHVFDDNPSKGWQAFFEPARFASGFAALFQTYSFVPETHMLKPFDQRVNATYALMQTFIKVAGEHADEIKNTRMQDRNNLNKQEDFVLDWKVDTTKPSTVTFKGYEAWYKPSEVTGLLRLYYDHKSPYTKQVPFHNLYRAKYTATAPKAYVIQHGWDKVINRLKSNGVEMHQLKKDSVLELKAYYIDNYETGQRPYEGHYLHTNIHAWIHPKKIQLLKGDYIIPVNQAAKRYLVEALEPQAPDGFFAWGYFDAILQQKEYYSDYVFEDDAAAFLKSDTVLRRQLEDKRKADKPFARDSKAQLDFVYHNSPYYEPVHMRYPVFRIE